MDQQVYLFYFQQCIALDDFSDAHSYYWAVGLLDLWTFGLLGFPTIGPSDYWAFGLLDLRTIGPWDYWAF